ncbi:MAG: YceI family protein [Gemmatimonadetes bacterium]|nr:YceI family protein [Gemmatimonadota bacterium]
MLDTATVEARYRVIERFAANTIDNEVVGVTRAVSGQVVLDVAGRPLPSESRLTIQLSGLKTDRTRRDSYVQKNTLETAKWPSAELAVRELRGLPAPLPLSGAFDVVVVGDLTLHGVTRSTNWTAKVAVSAAAVRGTARATVRFAEFGMAVPKVPLIARVDDPIALELDFVFVRPVDPNNQ